MSKDQKPDFCTDIDLTSGSNIDCLRLTPKVIQGHQRKKCHLWPEQKRDIFIWSTKWWDEWDKTYVLIFFRWLALCWLFMRKQVKKDDIFAKYRRINYCLPKGFQKLIRIFLVHLHINRILLKINIHHNYFFKIFYLFFFSISRYFCPFSSVFPSFT